MPNRRPKFHGLLKRVETAQDRCVNTAKDEMEDVLRRAVNYIWEHYEKTGHWGQPTLNHMYGVNLRFYRTVIEEACGLANVTKRADDRAALPVPRRPIKLGKKPGPMGIPRTLKSLEQMFRDKRAWPKVMKRSKKLTDRMRDAYLKKLKKAFDKLTPRVVAGEISPDEAKAELMDSWQASKSRVETIYRTETTNYFAKVQVNFFTGDPEIIGFLFDSVRDSARTNICRSRHGLVYRPGTPLLTENTPALHYNCRSHLIALANTPANRKLLEDPSRDPAKHKVAPLPEGWRK